jgi:hypothetical protein
VLLADTGWITGTFTLGGVLITALAAFWLDLSRQKREDRTRWDKERVLVYSEFLSHAQDVISDEAGDKPLDDILASAYRAKLLASGTVDDAVTEVTRKAALLQAARQNRDPDIAQRVIARERSFIRYMVARKDCLNAMKAELGGEPSRTPLEKATDST